MQEPSGQRSSPPTGDQSAPPHLIALPGSAWDVWRCVGLRSAGFPLADLLRLADPLCAAAADRLLRAELAFARLQQQTLDVLSRRQAEHSEERRRLRKIKDRLRKGRPLEPESGNAVAELSAYHAALADRAAAQAAFDHAFDAAIRRTSQTLAQIAQMPRFREAITWQNRRALHTGVQSLSQELLDIAQRDSQRRQHEALVARYWQRYCAKNDTIGFFGPLAWAWWTPQGAALTATPGDDLIASRRVCFEGWGIDTLAAALSANPALRPWMAPRAMPFLHLAASTVYAPEQAPRELSAAQALLLRRCDGTTPARTLANELLRAEPELFADEATVFRLLEQLVAAGLIAWAFEVPLDLYPERRLRALLERIDDPALSVSTLAMLDELEAARERVTLASGDPERLDRALDHLELVFTRLTGTEATRLAGRTYAARTLVYEDCRRALDVTLGPQLTQSLGGVLDLLLTSARWFTWEAAAIYRRVFQQIYNELVAETGTATIDFASFWQRAQSTLFSDIRQDHHGYVDALAQEHQSRWSRLLPLPAGERQVQFSSQTLRDQVHAAFDAPGPGWQAARYHSPDLMIAAASVDAIQRGEYHWVLGELHVAVNTLRISCFMNQHPQPSELIAALDQDLPAPRVVLIEDKDWSEFSERSRVALISPKDMRLAFAANTSEIAGPQILTVGALLIEERNGALLVRSRDDQRCYDPIEIFSDTLSILIASSWKIVPSAAYTPRITIDQVVVCRETWRVAASALAFAFEKNERDRFLGARRWAEAQGLPRHGFVKVPVELKPVYLDFDSPVLVDAFAKLVRRSAEADPHGMVTLTEMLPDHQQTWLPDANDQRYTCELRMIAVDRAV